LTKYVKANVPSEQARHLSVGLLVCFQWCILGN
jgi:hypothetical protein